LLQHEGTMNRLAYPQYKISPYLIVGIVYLLYVTVLAVYHDYAQVGISSLAIIAVIAGSWYFGIAGGILVAILSIIANVVLITATGRPQDVSLFDLSTDLRIFTLILVAVIIGRLGVVSRERREALIRLEELEKDRREYVNFLESLNEITRTALEGRDLQSTLKGLVERIARLFNADDAFFAFWDDENKISTPVIAYGSMSEVYPALHFEPDERTLTAAVMEFGRPLAIPDLKSSSHISPMVASMFPSRSMLGVPLMVQGKKIASFYLGYNSVHHFDEDEITYAEIAAQQMALVLTKIQLLEDAQKQVKQLTVLHEVALVSTQVETIDLLIDRVTEIIGKNLFPDNFGILLMDEKRGVLHPHTSYRFGSAKDRFPAKIPLGQGISGQVAQMGQPIRIGNVDGIQNYLEVDQETASELCVPIKLKDRVLGVINTESTRTDAFSMDDELLLGTMAGQLATAIEQLRAATAERQWLNQLTHSNELIYALAHITTHIEKALSQEEIIQTLGEELNKIDLTCIMAVYDADRRLFTINYTSIESKDLELIENGLGFPLLQYTFSRDKLNSVLKTGDILPSAAASDPRNEIQMLFNRPHREGISKILEGIGVTPNIEPLRLPLVFEETLLGILWVWGKGITKADLPIMSIFAKQIGISLERAHLFQEVQSLAMTDPLTGLHNRRSLFELGKIEFSRANRMNRPICCMMLDLDNFKQINDNYGHTIGDRVLQEFATRCKGSVREIDLIGRYGGEEFVVFLPETDIQTALQVAERLRTSIEETPMEVANQELTVTVSIGISKKDVNTLELETLIARADQAMYIAKHKGRNRVAISI
jgi:diguanylate cyclase (GGDEF)-like protein